MTHTNPSIPLNGYCTGLENIKSKYRSQRTMQLAFAGETNTDTPVLVTAEHGR